MSSTDTVSTPETYKISKTDIFTTDPRAIYVDWTKNHSRGGDEFTIDEEFENFARSLLPPSKGGQGQLEPIVVFRNSSKVDEVFVGFKRLRALLWLQENGIWPDPVVKFSRSSLNEEERAVANFTENLARTNPSNMQMARGCKYLRETLGFDEPKIRSIFKVSAQWLAMLNDLLTLPFDIQDKVEKKELGTTTAIAIAALPPEEQKEIIAEVRKGTKVKAKHVKEKAVKAAARMGTKVSGPNMTRSIKDLKSWLEEHSTGIDETPLAKRVAAQLIEYINMRRTDEQLDKFWKTIG